MLLPTISRNTDSKTQNCTHLLNIDSRHFIQNNMSVASKFMWILNIKSKARTYSQNMD